nr:MAG TPA: Major head protein [Caudoviricetes sp.]
MKQRLPLNLQFFAEQGEEGQQQNQAQQQQGTNQSTQTPSFDYEKLASIVAGKQNVTEDTVLKGYFKQQGLSKEEMEQAISAFKEQKAAQQPDVEKIQVQAVQAQQALQQSQIENKAILSAIELGLDVKTVPYLMKMADFSNVMKEDGTVNEDTIKEALNKVLEDVPALKQSTEKVTGFVQVGASGTQQQNNQSDLLAFAFGNKK